MKVIFIDSKLLITTGWNENKQITRSEIIDSSKSQNHYCFDWTDFPVGVYMATGGFLNGNLVICGGQLSDNPISYAQRCEKTDLHQKRLLSRVYTGCAICFRRFPIVLGYRKAVKTYGKPCIIGCL